MHRANTERVKRMYIKQCRICGKTFSAIKRTRMLCSEECRAENNRNLSNKHNAKRKEMAKPKPKAEKKESIVDLAVKAREMGMTYGQYTAMLYMQEGRV